MLGTYSRRSSGPAPEMQGAALDAQKQTQSPFSVASGFLLPSAFGADTLRGTDLSSHMPYFSCPPPHTLALNENNNNTDTWKQRRVKKSIIEISRCKECVPTGPPWSFRGSLTIFWRRLPLWMLSGTGAWRRFRQKYEQKK